MKPPYNTHVFEMSWEVCNKIGGIHTVIYSKLHEAMRAFSHYTLIGVANEHTLTQIEEETPPAGIREAAITLAGKGIKLHYGTERTAPHPKVILIDHRGYTEHTNAIKGTLWDEYGIDSLDSAWHDFDEAMLWAWCGGLTVSTIAKHLRIPVLLHAHEWMAGISILAVKQEKHPSVATVFTTHATMLGRALSGHGENLYQIEEDLDAKEFSYRIGVHTKHQSEQAIAKHTDCFTTVSDITAKEATYFYGIKPDVLLYNGFDNRGIEDIGKLNARYFRMRESCNAFLTSYFHDFYAFDPDEHYLFYTSGRNEVRNKGTDILIKSLGELNQELRAQENPPKIVCLFLILVGEFPENPEVRDSITHREEGRPTGALEYGPLSTHAVSDDQEILTLLREHGLHNRYDDPVKVILMPSDLNGEDGFLNKPYYEVITGTDLGIFPSFYEPWGYTPLESISYGVPAISSDLAGFGISIKEVCGNSCPSTYLLKRRNRKEETIVKNLTKSLASFIHKPQKTLLAERSHAKALATHYDWQHFYAYYLKAYQHALKHHLS